MKNKGILIAIAIIVVAALVGVFIFLYLKDPEILTRSPSEIISGNENGGEIIPIGDNGKPPSMMSEFLDPQGDCLLVSSSNCKFSLFFHNPDGERINGGVFFSGFPEKLKLYAPMSGYLTVISGNNPFQHVVVYISEVADDVTKWDDFGPATGRYVTFTAQEIELLDAEVRDGSLYVEKGKPFAEVTKKADMFPDLYEEKVELMFIFDRNWADMLDVSIDDPREYVKKAVENIN
jgi:hypothetical protein